VRAALPLLAAIIAAPLAAQAPTPIQDNSFLVEEAYNQEAGVVQHVSVFAHNRTTGDWEYGFTQEWPAPGLRHQLSYTVPLERARDGDGGSRGLGDVALNYRYQWIGDSSAPLAVAPRASLVLPTGSARRGGARWGVQANLPASLVISPRLVAHTNVGATHTFARDGVGASTELAVGQSGVWLLRPNFNFLLEAAYTLADEVDGNRGELTVAPGVRGAINTRGGLQIVPGLAVPIGVGRGRPDTAVLLYLSLEHAFRRAR
jgi:hypothetical protein